MRSLSIYPKLTKDYLLNTIPQEKIMEYYLKIPVIDDNFIGSAFCNPFREDNNPTCNYYYDGNNKLRVRDFGGELMDRLYNMDVFDVVAHIYNLNSNEPQHFKLIQHIIAKDFRINIYADKEEEVIRMDEFLAIQKKRKRKLKLIRVVPRAWNKQDENYWYKGYGISHHTLKTHKVLPAAEVWLEDNAGYMNRIYVYNPKNPAYAYYGGKEAEINLWKIYFPLNKDPRYNKIVTNKQFEQGIDTFLPTKVGIITKSYKDVMVLKEFGLQSVTLAAESIFLSADTFFKLKVLSGFQISLLDYDTAGIKMANRLKREYNVQPLMLTRGRFGKPNYGVKDISDFRKAYGREKTYQLILQSMEYLEDRFEDLEKQRQQLLWI